MPNEWREIEGFPLLGPEVQSALEQLEPLKHAWEEAARSDPQLFQDTRLRALRAHAIETGIIERLYEVDWGVTETLVAEGLSQEVVERTGGIERETLDIIHDQYEALEFVADYARGEHGLTVQFIRELHQLITRHQDTYEATDQFGHTVYPALRHGDWKSEKNNVVRPDGSKHEYCPPERVQDQMEALVGMLESNGEVHAVVRAAWLHHRFISIHPFQDGNGRVARALVLLELLRAHFAPIVVGRDIRAEYIQQLDIANDGNLAPLVLLFASLEQQAMIRQFQAPLSVDSYGGSVLDVARAAAGKLVDLQKAARKTKSLRLATLAQEINSRVNSKLNVLATELKHIFEQADPQAEAWVASADVGQPKARHYHGQLVKLAKRHDFFGNFTDGSWWTTLTLKIHEERMRLLVAVVKVGGGETGVGAVVIQGERLYQDEGEITPSFEWLFEPTDLDKIPITGELKIHEVENRVSELIERCLSASLTEFTRTLA